MRRIAKQYRQGDVLFHPVSAIPATAKKIPTPKRLVLAEGEATGHAHVITPKRSDLLVYLDGPVMYLDIKKPSLLKHEEHALIPVESGLYAIRRQVESWLDEVRQVAD